MGFSPFVITTAAIAAGYVLDLLVGDPHWLYHPVRLVGALIAGLEKVLRRMFPAGRTGERLAGFVLTVLTVCVTGAAAYGLCHLGQRIGSWGSFLVQTLLCYWLYAVKSLKDESMKVARELEKADLPGARRAVSMIVGRDTAQLDETGVAKAAVETVAENTSDGILAPMLYMVIGGPVLGWCYKAVNTMDSMVGYKNDKYRYLGTCAAKLDDIVNFFPARISALSMILCSPLAGLNGREAMRIFRRDRYNHASPNSAQTESVMAGALTVQLAGPASYFGRVLEKPTIGDPTRPVETADIGRANRLLYVTSAVSLVLFLGVRILCGRLWKLI